MKYAFVRANRQEFHVTRMCQVLQVSRSGYYDWQVRKECERSRQDGVLLKKIRKIHLEMKEAYGATKTGGGPYSSPGRSVESIESPGSGERQG